MDGTYGIEDIEIMLHHFHKRLMRNACDEIRIIVLLDEPVPLIEVREDFFRDIAQKRGAFHVRHFGSDFAHVVDADDAENRACVSAFAHSHFHIGAVHEVEHHEGVFHTFRVRHVLMENAEERAIGMAVEPSGLAPYFRNFLTCDQVLETCAFLRIISQPAPEYAIRPDELLAAVHHRNPDRQVLDGIDSPGRHASRQIVQVLHQLLFLREVAPFRIDDASCDDDEKKDTELPVLGRQHDDCQKQQRHVDPAGFLINPNITEHFASPFYTFLSRGSYQRG